MLAVEPQPWTGGRGRLDDPGWGHDGGSGCQGDVDGALISSLGQLMKLYSSMETPVMSGGLQQLLNRRARSGTSTSTENQPRRGAGSDHTTFHDLPDSLQLHMFSFLPAADLCRAALVCKHWLMLGSDDLLWHRRLQVDIQGWDVIGHLTNPYMYEECQSDWAWKHIYLRCSPKVNSILRRQNFAVQQLSSLLHALWTRRAPRVAMFGPGLESSTSGLVRKIIQDQQDPFKVTGMFPGQFEGVGSGFTIKMHSVAFKLMTLYATTKRERENLRQGERLQRSHLLAVQQEAAEAGEQKYELRPAIKDLCRTVDAFVFVVDASQDNTSFSVAHQELFAMVDEMWAAPHVPVLVLSCVSHQGAPQMSCVNVVQQLQLSKLSRPWQVHNCCVEELQGVPSAFQWLIEQSSRR